MTSVHHGLRAHGMVGVGETHQLPFWQDLPVQSEFLAAPSLAFANRRQTWAKWWKGVVALCLGKGVIDLRGDGIPGPQFCNLNLLLENRSRCWHTHCDSCVHISSKHGTIALVSMS